MERQDLEKHIYYYAELEEYKNYIKRKQDKVAEILLIEMRKLQSSKIETNYLDIRKDNENNHLVIERKDL